MKKFFLIAVSTLILSACGLPRQSTSSSPLDQEITSPEDKQILKAFDQDKDIDFSTEFKQLDSDLQ